MSNLPVIFDGATLGVIDPESGEVYSLGDAPPDVLANVEQLCAQVAQEARNAKAVLDDELSRRMGRERKVDYGPFHVESGERREWDADQTWRALADLCEAGLITPKEVDDAMPEVTTRKPDGRALNAILTRVVGEDPAKAQALAQARTGRRWVKITKTAVDSTVAS